MQVTQDRNHIQGPAAEPVTLFQYGDDECPYSRAAYPIIKEIQTDDSYEIGTLLASLERAAAPERDTG